MKIRTTEILSLVLLPFLTMTSSQKLSGGVEEQLKCVSNYACNVNGANLIGFVNVISSETTSLLERIFLCQSECRANAKCQHFTWYDRGGTIPLTCYLYSACPSTNKACADCHSGPRDCSPAHKPCPALQEDFGGNWFCFPEMFSIEKPVQHSSRCIFQCPQHITYHVCHDGEWSLAPGHKKCSCPPLGFHRDEERAGKVVCFPPQAMDEPSEEGTYCIHACHGHPRSEFRCHHGQWTAQPSQLTCHVEDRIQAPTRDEFVVSEKAAASSNGGLGGHRNQFLAAGNGRAIAGSSNSTDQRNKDSQQTTADAKGGSPGDSSRAPIYNRIQPVEAMALRSNDSYGPRANYFQGIHNQQVNVTNYLSSDGQIFYSPAVAINASDINSFRQNGNVLTQGSSTLPSNVNLNTLDTSISADNLEAHGNRPQAKIRDQEDSALNINPSLATSELPRYEKSSRLSSQKQNNAKDKHEQHLKSKFSLPNQYISDMATTAAVDDDQSIKPALLESPQQSLSSDLQTEETRQHSQTSYASWANENPLVDPRTANEPVNNPSNQNWFPAPKKEQDTLPLYVATRGNAGFVNNIPLTNPTFTQAQAIEQGQQQKSEVNNANDRLNKNSLLETQFRDMENSRHDDQVDEDDDSKDLERQAVVAAILSLNPNKERMQSENPADSFTPSNENEYKAAQQNSIRFGKKQDLETVPSFETPSDLSELVQKILEGSKMNSDEVPTNANGSAPANQIDFKNSFKSEMETLLRSYNISLSNAIVQSLSDIHSASTTDSPNFPSPPKPVEKPRLSAACRHPAPVLYGNIRCQGRVASGFLEQGSTCHLSCEPGFATVGHEMTVCGSNGAWISTSPLLCVEAVAMIIGGWNTERSMIDDVEIFDATSNCSDIAVASLPQPRSGIVAAWIGGKVLVCGGVNNASHNNLCWNYEPASNTWLQLPFQMTTERHFAASVKVQARLLALGGRDGRERPVSLESVESFQGKQWREESDFALTQNRVYHCAALLDEDTVIITGGYSRSTVVVRSEALNVTSGEWEEIEDGDLIYPRYLHGCSSVTLQDGKTQGLLVAGGYDSGYLDSAELFNPAIGRWAEVGRLSVPRQGGRMAVLGAKPTMMGGFHSMSVYPASVEQFDVGSMSWVTLMGRELKTPRRYFAVAEVPRTLFDKCR